MPQEPNLRSSMAGRVLRLKAGYNPNSSSIGSGVPSFLAFAVGAGAFTVVLLNVLHAAARLIRTRRAAESQTEKSS